MKVAIMQPYFFPYLGYFALIRASERFVAFDTAQYIRHGWVNRNRILHPKTGWQYIGVPVAQHARESSIQDVRIDQTQDWRGRLLGQLTHYRSRSRRYAEVVEFVRSAIAPEYETIAELNQGVLRACCDHVGLPLNASRWSQHTEAIEPASHPGGWAPAIAAAIGATGYINPIGGEELFREEDFLRAGVELELLRMKEITYSQRSEAFEPWLSIIDVLMFNPREHVLSLLDEHELVPPWSGAATEDSAAAP